MFEDYINDEDYVMSFYYGQLDVNHKQEPIDELANLTTDELLDKYNDYDELHKIFGDEIYKVKMNEIIKISTESN